MIKMNEVMNKHERRMFHANFPSDFKGPLISVIGLLHLRFLYVLKLKDYKRQNMDGNVDSHHNLHGS